MQPADYDIPLLPGELARAEVIPDLRCRQCGYNLRALVAAGDCPECGLPIWQTIIRETDPEVSQLPRLQDARGVANGLVWLTLIMLVAALMLIAGPVTAQLGRWGVTIPAQLWFLQSPLVPYLTGALALAGLWSVWKLLPGRRGDETAIVWRDVRLIGLGLVGWSAMFLLLGSVFNAPELSSIRTSAVLVSHAFAASVFLGLRGVFRTIGERSREYRRSQGGRQNLGAMVGALLGVAAGDGIAIMRSSHLLGADWLIVAGILRWVCGFLLVLGLGYLLGNACMIRRSITRPPRSLDELLMPEIPRDVRLEEDEAEGSAVADHEGDEAASLAGRRGGPASH